MSENRHDEIFKKGLESLSPSDFPYDPSGWDQLNEQMDNEGILLSASGSTGVQATVWRWLTGFLTVLLLLLGWQWYDLSHTVAQQAQTVATYRAEVVALRDALKSQAPKAGIRRKASASHVPTETSTYGRIIDTIVIERRIYIQSEPQSGTGASVSPAFRRMQPTSGVPPYTGAPRSERIGEDAAAHAQDSTSSQITAPRLQRPISPSRAPVSKPIAAVGEEAQVDSLVVAVDVSAAVRLDSLARLPIAALEGAALDSVAVDTVAAAQPKGRSVAQKISDRIQYGVQQGGWSMELLGTHYFAFGNTRYTRSEWNTGLGVSRGIGKALSLGAQLQWSYDDNYLDGINGLTDVEDSYFAAYPNVEANKNDPADALNRVEGKLQAATLALVVGYEPWRSRALHPFVQAGAVWRMDLQQELEYYYLRAPSYGSLYEVHESAATQRAALSALQMQAGLAWMATPQWGLRLSATYQHGIGQDTWEPTTIHRLGGQLGIMYRW